MIEAGRVCRVLETGEVQQRVFRAGLLPAIAVLVALAVFDGSGSRDDALATVGIAALATATVAAGASLLGLLPRPRLGARELAACLGIAALTAWAGLSIVWSIAGDRSWEWLGRGAVYLAFALLGLLAGTRARGLRRTAAVLAGVIAAALVWALLGVAIPSLFEDGDRIARLREPVDYWNALALLAGGGLGLGLWVGRSRGAIVRASGAVGVFVAVVALLLTQSRAGVVGGAAVLCLWFVLSDERVADALRALLGIVPGLLVVGWAFTQPALVEDGALRSDRVADGRVFAVLTLAGAVLVAVAAWRLPVERLAATHAGPVRRGLVIVCVVGAVVAGGGLVAAVGNPFSWVSSQVSRGECVNEPGRLGELCANNRLAWWEESLRIAADRPLAGSGAGTFEIARARYREDASRPASEPHSVPLQLLADLGAIGLLLGIVVALGAVLGVRHGLRRADGRERPAAIALAGLVFAYGVHALVDYPLDFIAVTAPALVALGALLAVGREPVAGGRSGLPALVAIGAVGAAAILAVALPALAERDAERAFTSADAGRIEEAVDAAERARRLDPLSLAPLEALATAADVAGNEARAVAWYEEATELQPENPDTWYALGLYHTLATGDLCAAYQAFNSSYTLDPRSSRWPPDGPLDDAREAVDDGACER